jgi:hypothetical protein
VIIELQINLQTAASGKVAAIFISCSLSVLVIGILTLLRSQLAWLEVYPPAGTFSGIWLYSYMIWVVLWVGLYIILRHKENIGTIKTWLIFFLASLATTTVLIEVSLNWSSLLK